MLHFQGSEGTLEDIQACDKEEETRGMRLTGSIETEEERDGS
jgi:hypothetical protein